MNGSRVSVPGSQLRVGIEGATELMNNSNHRSKF
jgi:hypothetical protein